MAWMKLRDPLQRERVLLSLVALLAAWHVLNKWQLLAHDGGSTSHPVSGGGNVSEPDAHAGRESFGGLLRHNAHLELQLQLCSKQLEMAHSAACNFATRRCNGRLSAGRCR